MDIYVNIHGYLWIHAWTCYGFSFQGLLGFRHGNVVITTASSFEDLVS